MVGRSLVEVGVDRGRAMWADGCFRYKSTHSHHGNYAPRARRRVESCCRWAPRSSISCCWGCGRSGADLRRARRIGCGCRTGCPCLFYTAVAPRGLALCVCVSKEGKCTWVRKRPCVRVMCDDVAFDAMHPVDRDFRSNKTGADRIDRLAGWLKVPADRSIGIDKAWH